MENTNKLESGFKINNLILAESSFLRINNVAFEEGIINDFDVSVEVSVKENTVIVGENVNIIQKFKDVEQVKINVRMVGIFERIGDTEIKDLDEFGRVNGAAIIFPYITCNKPFFKGRN